MDAETLYRDGHLSEARTAQAHEVSAYPEDKSKRLFLFELLAFSGELDKAAQHLNLLTYDEVDLSAAVDAYRRIIDAEHLRRRVFNEGLRPDFLGEPSEHLELRFEATLRLREGNVSEAAQLLAKADQAVVSRTGTLNSHPFKSLRDADDLFSYVIEVMAHGRYIWVGLEQVNTLTINAPQYPRDLLYIPAFLETEIERGQVFLPSLYPMSHEHSDENVKLGRMTDWVSINEDLTRGFGLHTYLCDDDGIGLLEWRQYQAEQA